MSLGQIRSCGMFMTHNHVVDASGSHVVVVRVEQSWLVPFAAMIPVTPVVAAR
jgi:hypothetical protein